MNAWLLRLLNWLNDNTKSKEEIKKEYKEMGQYLKNKYGK